MNEEQLFIRRIVTDGLDDVRLVYADWLEERGDRRRAEYLRLDVQAGVAGKEYDEAREQRRRELAEEISSVWIALVSMYPQFGTYPAEHLPLRPCPECQQRIPIEAVVCPRCSAVFDPEIVRRRLVCPNRICACIIRPGDKHCLNCRFPLPTPSGSIIAGRYEINPQSDAVPHDDFGYVYQGTDTRGGSPVEIRELLCENSEDLSYLLPFFQEEAVTLHRLQSDPRVPRILDLVHDDRTAFLVLEGSRSDSLEELRATTDGPTLPFNVVRHIGLQLCELLKWVHAHDLLVCNQLCLDNLFLLADQQSVKLRLAGFTTGRVGHLLEKRLEWLQGIAFRHIHGRLYIPPEAAIGRPEERSDLFRLADVLYQLLSGNPSEGFHGALDIESLLSSNSCPIPPSQRWLYEVIAANLSEEAGDRYYSVLDLQTDLLERKVSHERVCLGCGQKNGMREPQCSRCSQPLTPLARYPCPECGERYRMGSTACAKCGRRLWR